MRAFRILTQGPGFAAIAILAFALGIGANSAIFSVVYSILLRPLGYADPERLVVAEHAGPSPVAPATYLDWRAQATSFEELAAAQAWGGSLRTNDRPEVVSGLQVSANLFTLLGVAPALGRTFLPSEDRDDAAPAVVIAYSLWQRSFGGAADIVGRQMVVDGVGYNVIGVMPQTFQFAPFWVTRAEMWAPLALGDRRIDRRGKSLRIFGRLKQGVTIEQAQTELSGIMDRLARQYPETNAKDTVAVTALRDRVTGGVQAMLLVLLGTVGFVLLIACANVANLMLARVTAKRRELAVRLALGATRWQLVRLSMAESGVLAGIGGLIGIGIAFAGVYALNAAVPPGTLPRQQEVGVNAMVLLFSAAVSIAAAMLAALFPALQASRGDVNEALQEGGRTGTAGRKGNRTRTALVVAEVALAFVLLTGAGLMLRSFERLLTQDAGFDPSHLLTMNISVSGTRQADPSRRASFYQEALERIARLPGTVAVGAVNHAPLTGDVWGMQFRVEGREEPRPGEWPNAVYRVAEPGYFAAMRTPLLRGRDFRQTDTMQTGRVAVVNESLARKHWPGEDAIGKRIWKEEWLTVVGVVRDMKQNDWAANPRDEVYFPLGQSQEYLTRNARHYEALQFVVRTSGDPAAQSTAVRSAIAAIDPNVLVSNVISMDRAVANNTWRSRLALLLLGAFGVVALMLAITGVYGVISHAVTQQRQEIGIRMALGATTGQVMTQSLRSGLRPVAAGIATGAALAMMLTGFMRTMLYGISAVDPLTFTGVAAAMMGAGLVAAFWPAFRAANAAPSAVLRHH